MAGVKPFSQACENNREPILAILREAFAHCSNVLEIGSGTGQHAVHFAAALPHLTWHTSDLVEHHAGIWLWLDEAGLANVTGPVELDVCQQPWPVPADLDAVFTANTLHIMAIDGVEALFAGLGRYLPVGGAACIYGPFNYGGRYTSASNARFDQWLHERDPASGIRDFERVASLAAAAGLDLVADHAMPANNRLLHFRRG